MTTVIWIFRYIMMFILHLRSLMEYIYSICCSTSIFQSPIGTSQVVSLETTASLALELSVGMDTINENLNSLSEKVKSLRISVINSVSAMLLLS